MTPEKKVFAERIINSVLEGNYRESTRIQDSLSKTSDPDPLWPLVRLMTIGLRDLDFDSTIDSAALVSQYRKAAASVELWRKMHGTDSYILTLDGFVRGTYASYNLQRKRYVESVQIGFEALDLLKKAYRLDSTDADADYFLGVYECTQSALKERLQWVLFWYPADRERGIRRLEHAVAGSHLSSTAARLSLIDIYVGMDRFDEALRYLRELETRFPESRFVTWARARYHEKRNEFSIAAECYRKLGDSYLTAGSWGEYNAVVTRYCEAGMREKIGEKTQTVQLCTRILARFGSIRNERIIAVCKDVRKLMDRNSDYGKHTP